MGFPHTPFLAVLSAGRTPACNSGAVVYGSLRPEPLPFFPGRLPSNRTRACAFCRCLAAAARVLPSGLLALFRSGVLRPVGGAFSFSDRLFSSGGADYRRQAGNFRGFSMGGDPCMNLCLCYLVNLFCCGGRGMFLCC